MNETKRGEGSYSISQLERCCYLLFFSNIADIIISLLFSVLFKISSTLINIQEEDALAWQIFRSIESF